MADAIMAGQGDGTTIPGGAGRLIRAREIDALSFAG
jgi:hypothetical protein